MKTFTLVMEKIALNQNTLINGKHITDEKELCKLMKHQFCKMNSCKNFQEWADELNQDENFEGGFTSFDALDSLSSLFILNIDGKHVSIYNLFKNYNDLLK
jgi:hypothetical protein